jgi:hypothetical protein
MSEPSLPYEKFRYAAEQPAPFMISVFELLAKALKFLNEFSTISLHEFINRFSAFQRNELL